jgi:hypothetical protein
MATPSTRHDPHADRGRHCRCRWPRSAPQTVAPGNWVLAATTDSYGSRMATSGDVGNPGLFTLAPVPEAETWAMLLAGLGLVGSHRPASAHHRRSPLMRRLLHATTLALLGSLALGASAQSSIQLGNYRLSGNYALDALGGIGLEASAVTYARDRNSLFFVGDEGRGIVEISLTGTTLGSMAFDWAGTGSTNQDAEGLTYLGNGQFVVVDERPQRAYRFSYQAGGTVLLGSAPFATISNYTPSNIGIEGISLDPRDGSFVTVKQDNDNNPARGPQEVRAGAMTFATGGGSTSCRCCSTPACSAWPACRTCRPSRHWTPWPAPRRRPPADPEPGLAAARRDHPERAGARQPGPGGFTTQAIEGLTIDHRGVIYLVAEDSGTPASRLLVLTPVPEPEAWSLLAPGWRCWSGGTRRRAPKA